jgi:hypothetical protein
MRKQSAYWPLTSLLPIALSLLLAPATCYAQTTPPPPPKPEKQKASKAEKTTLPVLKVEVDTADAPEMADWAAKAKALCEKSYPLLVRELGAPGFEPPDKVKLVVKKMDGVAHTSGGTITCSASWFTKHPDDTGAAVHELCHVVQNYGRTNTPGWVTEGIADYIRWFLIEPAEKRPRVRNPEKAKYTDSYQTAAAFFDWIVSTKDKTFINRLNAAARKNEYKPELFQQSAGKPLDELWTEFIESVKKK